jgi:hypothetical protein
MNNDQFIVSDDTKELFQPHIQHLIISLTVVKNTMQREEVIAKWLYQATQINTNLSSIVILYHDQTPNISIYTNIGIKILFVTHNDCKPATEIFKRRFWCTNHHSLYRLEQPSTWYILKENYGMELSEAIVGRPFLSTVPFNPSIIFNFLSQGRVSVADIDYLMNVYMTDASNTQEMYDIIKTAISTPRLLDNTIDPCSTLFLPYCNTNLNYEQLNKIKRLVCDNKMFFTSHTVIAQTLKNSNIASIVREVNTCENLSHLFSLYNQCNQEERSEWMSWFVHGWKASVLDCAYQQYPYTIKLPNWWNNRFGPQSLPKHVPIVFALSSVLSVHDFKQIMTLAHNRLLMIPYTSINCVWEETIKLMFSNCLFNHLEFLIGWRYNQRVHFTLKDCVSAQQVEKSFAQLIKHFIHGDDGMTITERLVNECDIKSFVSVCFDYKIIDASYRKPTKERKHTVMKQEPAKQNCFHKRAREMVSLPLQSKRTKIL